MNACGIEPGRTEPTINAVVTQRPRPMARPCFGLQRRHTIASLPRDCAGAAVIPLDSANFGTQRFDDRSTRRGGRSSKGQIAAPATAGPSRRARGVGNELGPRTRDPGRSRSRMFWGGLIQENALIAIISRTTCSGRTPFVHFMFLCGSYLGVKGKFEHKEII